MHPICQRSKVSPLWAESSVDGSVFKVEVSICLSYEFPGNLGAIYLHDHIVDLFAWHGLMNKLTMKLRFHDLNYCSLAIGL